MRAAPSSRWLSLASARASPPTTSGLRRLCAAIASSAAAAAARPLRSRSAMPSPRQQRGGLWKLWPCWLPALAGWWFASSWLLPWRAAWLASEHAFSQCVTEPIRLHVPATRFLCAVDPNYHSELSPASQLSLSLQGGPFTELEVAAFRETPYSESAVRLRQWDDRAKDPDLETPPLDHFLALIDSSMLNEQ